MSYAATNDGRNSWDKARSPGEPGAHDPRSLAQRYPTLKPTGKHDASPPIPLHRPITLIGSRRTARIHLNSPRVSKAHALLIMTPEGACIRDLLSREGTRIKGHPIKEMELRDGDEVQISQFSFIYRDPRPRSKQPPPAVEPLALQIATPAGRKRIVLEKRVTLIGRRRGSDVELPYPEISTANTAIVRLDGFAGESDSMGFIGWAVFDLGGKGTLLNGQPIHKARLSAGDVIGIGPVQIELLALAEMESGVDLAEVRPAAAARTAPLPTTQEADVVSAQDLDEIGLEEDLTPEGLEEDLLGGSHVMEAIAEPEAFPEEPEAAPLSAEDLLEPPGEDAPSFDADALRAEAPEEPAPTYFRETEPRDWSSVRAVETQEVASAWQEGPLESPVSDSPAPGSETAPPDIGIEAEDVFAAPAANEPEPHEVWDEGHFAAQEATEAPGVPDVRQLAPDTVQGWAADEVVSAAGINEEPEEWQEPGASEDAISEWLESEASAPEVAQAFESGPSASDDFAEAYETTEASVETDVTPEVPEIDLSKLDFDESLGATAEAPPTPIDLGVRPDDSDDHALPGNELDLERLAESAEIAPADELGEEPGQEHWQPEQRQADHEEWTTASSEAAGEFSLDSGAAGGYHEIDADPEAQPEEALEVLPYPENEVSGEASGTRWEPEPFEQPLVHESSDHFVAAETVAPALSDEHPGSSETGEPLFGAFAPSEQMEDEFVPPVEEDRWMDVPDEMTQPEVQAPVSLREEVGHEQLSAPQDVSWAGEEAAGDASDREMILGATEPTPESAFDLEALELEDAATRREPVEPGLSDSALAMELEALSEETGSALNASEDVFDDVSLHAAESAVPSAHQPFVAQEETGAPAEPSEAAGTADERREQQQVPPARSGEAARVRWEMQQSAFLGNLTSIGSEFSIPPPSPAAAAARLNQFPKKQTPTRHAIEQAPEGLADRDAASAARASAALRDDTGAGTSPPPAAADDEEDYQFAIDDEADESVEPDASDSGAPDKPAKPPRPHKISFGGPVSEMHEAIAPGAANPFSSQPVGGAGGPVLDPSAVMPEGSGLPQFTSAMAGSPGEGHRPLMVREGAELDPKAVALEEEDLHEHEASRLDSGRAAALAQEDLETARMDEFARTVRAGVRPQAGAPAVHDSKGINGQALHAATSPPPRVLIRGRSQVAGGGAAEPVFSEPVLAELAPPRRRLFLALPLLIGLAFVVAIGAVAGIWYLMQPTVPVTLKLRYSVPESMSQQAQVQYRQDQLDRLLDDSLRQSALEVLGRTGPGVAADYLSTVASYNQFALQAAWSTREPNTLLLSRSVPVSQRSAESERLKAVATALYDRGGTERATREQFAGEVTQLEEELEKLRRENEELTGQIEEAVASLPAPAAVGPDASAEEELDQRIERLDEQWSAAGRRVAQLRQQIDMMEASDPIAQDEQLADMKRRLADVEAQIASSVSPEGAGGSEETAEPAAGKIEDASGQPGEADVAAIRDGGARLDAALAALKGQTEAVAAKLDADHAVQLREHSAGFAGAIEALVKETHPDQIMVGGEVELLRQSLAKVRRERSMAMLEQDERVRSLRAEVSLRERELGAALSDGLADRAAGLRMALRLARDRLSLRVDEVNGRLEEDEKVVAARRAYELTEREARSALAAQRQAFESVLVEHRTAIERLTPAAEAAAMVAALADAEAAVRAAILEKSRRLPLLADIWADPPQQRKPSAEHPQDQSGARLQSGSGEAPASDGADPAALLVAHVSQQDPPPATRDTLQEQARELRQRIARREADLRQEHDQRLVELRQQLTAAEAAAAKAQREAQQARAELGELRAGQDSAERARQRVAQMRVYRVYLESDIAEKERNLARARAASGVLATPLPPADVDIDAPVPTDPRPQAIFYSLMSIAVLTLVGLFFTLRGASRT